MGELSLISLRYELNIANFWEFSSLSRKENKTNRNTGILVKALQYKEQINEWKYT